jgi:hypothetical protein
MEPVKRTRQEINQANARKSTGPKTEVGKRRSSLNAYRHGMTGQLAVMPEHERIAFAKFEKSFYDTYNPQGANEIQYVQTMADSAWKLNRGRVWQDMILCQNAKFAPHQDATPDNMPEINIALAISAVVQATLQDLGKFSLYEQREQRMYQRAEERLAIVQAERRRLEKRSMEEAVLLLRLHEFEEEARQKQAAAAQPGEAYFEQPYRPETDGFVFSLVEIKAHRLREARLKAAHGLPKFVHKAAA